MPGEHDTSFDDGKMYMERYGKNAKGRGWHSFNRKDVHFVGLSNVAVLEVAGKLGPEQLQWLEADSRRSRPAARWYSSRTFPCGRFIRSGDGVRRNARRHSATSNASSR